ncbi:hypothetical protein BO86DRAFT_52989 [Aspergillus japonicus CBS 114.51]|uniref:Uncharacterized protein n=1 Tax=Aspergillus japonicus CBS 114.51 TaxID=1448312 RepID=A0A8T8WJ90_ASPJA|nr:hypothetical protein BO86DRAFT_52989 [Aspergillus japonicus CBS 114.51]RAH75766.1 hypothetical protein BO86DRAFT_52989 [Aspergillus japonicus CBS 114.51]
MCCWKGRRQQQQVGHVVSSCLCHGVESCEVRGRRPDSRNRRWHANYLSGIILNPSSLLSAVSSALILHNFQDFNMTVTLLIPCLGLWRGENWGLNRAEAS